MWGQNISRGIVPSTSALPFNQSNMDSPDAGLTMKLTHSQRLSLSLVSQCNPDNRDLPNIESRKCSFYNIWYLCPNRYGTGVHELLSRIQWFNSVESSWSVIISVYDLCFSLSYIFPTIWQNIWALFPTLQRFLSFIWLKWYDKMPSHCI